MSIGTRQLHLVAESERAALSSTAEVETQKPSQDGVDDRKTALQQAVRSAKENERNL
jgi:hypothetical protein